MAAIIVGGVLVALFVLLLLYISSTICNIDRFGERNTYRIQKKGDKYWVQIFNTDCDYSEGTCWVYMHDKSFDTHREAEEEIKRLVNLDKSKII